jgi:hypothetical protein
MPSKTLHIAQLYHLSLITIRKSQYEHQLNKWGIRVNLKDPEWRSLLQILSSLPNSGEYHEVRLTGRLITAERIARERSRRQMTDANVEGQISQACPEIPKGITFHPPLDVQHLPCAPDTIPPSLELTLIDPKTYSVPLLASSSINMPAFSDIEWQHQPTFLGIFEPHAWTRAIDWMPLTSLSQRNSWNAKLLDIIDKISFVSVVGCPLQNNGQLIVRDPDFLIPFYLLSSLLNGTEPSVNVTNSQLHGVMRALPKSVVLKLFGTLDSPFSDMLRERVFASALNAGDAETVEAMLSLGLDPCERIWFDSGVGSDLPLERALYFNKFSVCKAIVNHRCKPQSCSARDSSQDEVLRELLDGYYQLVNRHFPLTSSEWREFSDLLQTALSQGARPTNECFLVAYHDDSLAHHLITLECTGVNGWIKRGLLALRWPEVQNRTSKLKEVESQQIHWILNYVLRQHRNEIDRKDPEIVAEVLRALKTAVITRDPGATHIIVEACKEPKGVFNHKLPEKTLTDFISPSLQQNQTTAQSLVEEHVSHGCCSIPDKDQTIEQRHLKRIQKDLYETIAKDIAVGDDTGFSQAAEQYLNDADMRYYLHTRSDYADQRLFRLAVEKNHLELIAALFRGLTSDYPRRLELHWSLAHVLQIGSTAAMSAILRDSEPLAKAFASVEEDPPIYSALEDLLYRVQDTSLLCLSGSNAHHQILLRCLCFHAIHTSNGSLVKWLTKNGLDTDEYGIYLSGELYQVFFENMQKMTAHGGLMPNSGSGLPIQIFPSLLSIAAMQNNVSMIRLLVELGADGRDSMALARAVQAGASTATIEALLQAADPDDEGRRKKRHYGSSALREIIRRKNYELLRSLARRVDIDGIELLPNEMPDPRSVEPLSPLGEAILLQDNIAVGILLAGGCDHQALVCYDGFPEEHKRGAHLRRLSPLLAAIDLHNLLIAQMLVEHGASVAPGPTQGLLRSPLQRAAEVGCFEIVEYLLSCNAPVDDSPFYSGGTPLQLAALSGHDKISELLLENHADPNHPPARGDGRSAFEAAAERGRSNIMSLLIKRGTDLDLKFEDDMRSQYDRALHFAENNGHPASKRFVQILYKDLVAARFESSLMDFCGSTHGGTSLEGFPMEMANMLWTSDDRTLFDGS